METMNWQYRPGGTKLALVMAVLALGFTLAGINTASAQGFAITKKIPIPGQGKWDCQSGRTCRCLR